MIELGLGEVICALRAELEGAIKEGEGKDIQFEPTAIDLEFSVGVTQSADGKAGIRFWVVELGGGGSYTSESVQMMRLSLHPVSATGANVRIVSGTDLNPLSPRSKSSGG